MIERYASGGSPPPPASAVIDRAVGTDRVAVAGLFAEDLVALRMTADVTALEVLFDQMVEDPRSIVLVCREAKGGEAQGVLVANRFLSVKYAGESLWIEELYVGRRWRRRGRGRLLVEGLLDMARAMAVRGIGLEAYQGNDAAAILYRSLDFRRLGRERFGYDFAWEREVDDEP